MAGRPAHLPGGVQGQGVDPVQAEGQVAAQRDRGARAQRLRVQVPVEGRRRSPQRLRGEAQGLSAGDLPQLPVQPHLDCLGQLRQELHPDGAVGEGQVGEIVAARGGPLREDQDRLDRPGLGGGAVEQAEGQRVEGRRKAGPGAGGLAGHGEVEGQRDRRLPGEGKPGLHDGGGDFRRRPEHLQAERPAARQRLDGDVHGARLAIGQGDVGAALSDKLAGGVERPDLDAPLAHAQIRELHGRLGAGRVCDRASRPLRADLEAGGREVHRRQERFGGEHGKGEGEPGPGGRALGCRVAAARREPGKGQGQCGRGQHPREAAEAVHTFLLGRDWIDYQ